MLKTRKIRLTRPVVVSGHGECVVGDEFELAAHLAHDLVGSHCAEYADDGKHPNLAGVVTRVVEPEDADPVPKKLTGQKKVAAKAADKE